MKKRAVLLGLLIIGVPAAAAFNFGVSPAKIEKGVQQPGTQFYVDFFVMSASDRDISVDLTADTAPLSSFDRFKPDAAGNYSEQDCDCVNFLSGQGPLEERSQAIRNADRWNSAKFLVQLPDDIEPGYHMLSITPSPSVSGGGGGVSVVSSASLPVIFRVPGPATRSGKVIGVRSAGRVHNRQRVAATFYNTGTVTVTVDMRFVAAGLDGNVTVGGGEKRVAPGGSQEFTGSVPVAAVNQTFPVYAVADYGTGTAAGSMTMRVEKRPVTGDVVRERTPLPWLSLLLVLLVAATTAVTWRVVRG